MEKTYSGYQAPGYLKVTFYVIATGEVFTRAFDSEYRARIFVGKLRHSKRCRMISCTNFVV